MNCGDRYDQGFVLLDESRVSFFSFLFYNGMDPLVDFPGSCVALWG